MKFGRNHEEGFTGLEAAIVLIAFVVVAAVFSYVMLGAGFFTSQKSQEVVHTSVATASASAEIKGNVYGLGNGANAVNAIQFTLSTTAGGGSIDLSKMVITYIDSTNAGIIPYNAADTTIGKWSILERPEDDGDADAILEEGEQYIIKVELPTDPDGEVGTNDAWLLAPNTQFTLDLKPAVGSALGISRTIPAQVETVNLLY